MAIPKKKDREQTPLQREKAEAGQLAPAPEEPGLPGRLGALEMPGAPKGGAEPQMRREALGSKMGRPMQRMQEPDPRQELQNIKEALRQRMGKPMQSIDRAAGQPGEADAPAIGREEIEKAREILTRYKNGKANLEERIVQDELWWEMRHWEILRKRNQTMQPEPSSAWLFNTIQNKHADAMDNIPEPLILPREQSDEESARALSSVLPAILEYNQFPRTYAENWWEKLKHGTAVYGVFWNPEKENGLGDVEIQQIDLLKIFWEPGITDIQKSRNLFVVDLVDEEVLDQQYPRHKGRLGGNVIDVKQYIYDDNVDTEGKSVVVDWYYKKRSRTGRQVLHYVKFVGDVLLYASENDPRYREGGWYEHGDYPVVFDTLYPEKGTPVGFGFVAVCRDPQMYIDRLSANILENSMMATKKRFFASANTNVNIEEFTDWTKPIVHVEGELDERRLKEITVDPISSIYVQIQQMKIDEMKDTASNRDVNSGGVGSGVTAAAAISALQEAGNKVSRDMINASYRAYTGVVTLCLELVRQFYDEQRSFRILMPNGSVGFTSFSNAGIRPQMGAPSYPGQAQLYRRPVFDIRISAQKKNPFTRVEQNERAMQLYQMGFFNPERAQEAMSCLDMMEFEGIDKIRSKVAEGETLLNTCQQMAQQLDQMAAIIQMSTGRDMGITGAAPPSGGGRPQGPAAAGGPKAGGEGIMEAQKQNQTSYAQKLAKRSAVDVAKGARGK